MKPYYERDGITIYHGDCREVLPQIERADCAIVDPPYGETSLDWDVPIREWAALLPTASLWCFGSLRMFMLHAVEFDGWSFAQDVIWEKHNGSNSFADRFRRVHEIVAQFYRVNDLSASPKLPKMLDIGPDTRKTRSGRAAMVYRVPQP